MIILFDHGTPRGIAAVLRHHAVFTASSRGWDRLINGDLLRAAEDAGIDLLLTTDRRMRYQQNLSSRRITVVVLVGTTKWSKVRMHLERIAAGIESARPGSYSEITIPMD